jgi:iron complex transport system substrate-binding protein
MPSYSRRSFLLGTGALAALALAGCGDDSSGGAGSSTSDGPWQFTDDRNITAKRDKRPTRIVTYVSSGAALWDFGTRPIGVFGPQKTAEGKQEIQAGNIDLGTTRSVGEAWDDFNVEKFAALRPDLLVTGLTGTKPTDLWVITEEIGKKVEQIAPVVALSEYKKPLPQVIQRYSDLAKALGADVDAAAVKTAKDEFQKASDGLRKAAQAKPGLKVCVLYADKDNIYIAKPEFFADLSYYKELGLDLVAGGGADDYWEKLSWEEIGKYPADLILTDTRTYALSRQQMAAYPTWSNLAAVKAGQVGDWSAEPRFNYTLATPVLRNLTKAINGAKTDIVA